MTTKIRVSVTGILVGVFLAASNFGCGGSSSLTTPPPAVSVSVSPNTATVQAGATAQFTATVANDSANKGVNWSVSCSAAPCGSVSPASTASGTATTYSARSAPPASNLAVTITATSITDTTKSAAASVTTPAPQPLTITTTSLPNGTVNVPYSMTTLQSSGGTPPVTWSLGTGTTLPPGLSLSSGGTISGTPTAPGGASFAVLATDSATPTPQKASQDLSISINAADASHNALLNGHYAFLMSGFTRHVEAESIPHVYATAGSFVADGLGNLTSGVSDTSTAGGVTANQPFTGTYSLGSDNRGTMSINSSGGTVTRAFSVGSISSSGVATKGRIITFLSNDAPSTGEFDLQDTTAFSTSAISGAYAFGLGGGGVLSAFGADGVFTADGAGNIPSGSGDTNQAGVGYSTFTPDQQLNGTYGVTSPTSGRGTARLTIGGTTLNVAFYVVSASKLLIVSAEQAINTAFTNVGSGTGQALKQSGGSFTNGSLHGAGVLSTFATFDGVTAGVATFDGAGTITLLQDHNNAGVVTSGSTITETYSVASNGRVNVTAAGSTVSALYLVSPGMAFILNTDSNAGTGFLEPQSAGPLSNSSINGRFFFGDPSPSCCGTPAISGVATLNAGVMNLTSDTDQLGMPLVYAQTSTDTYSISPNGRGTTGSGNEVIYIVSPNKFVVIDVNPSDTLPTIKVFEQ